MIDIPNPLPISYDAAFAAALCEAKQIGYKPGDAIAVARQVAATSTNSPPRQSSAAAEFFSERVASEGFCARP